MPSEQHRPADAGNSPAASAVQPVSSAEWLRLVVTGFTAFMAGPKPGK